MRKRALGHVVEYTTPSGEVRRTERPTSAYDAAQLAAAMRRGGHHAARAVPVWADEPVLATSDELRDGVKRAVASLERGPLPPREQLDLLATCSLLGRGGR